VMLVYLSHTDVNNKNKYHPVDITVTTWSEAASVATNCINSFYSLSKGKNILSKCSV